MSKIKEMQKEKWIPIAYIIESIVFAIPSEIYVFTHDTI